MPSKPYHGTVQEISSSPLFSYLEIPIFSKRRHGEGIKHWFHSIYLNVVDSAGPELSLRIDFNSHRLIDK